MLSVQAYALCVQELAGILLSFVSILAVSAHLAIAAHEELTHACFLLWKAAIAR